jgi:hypothetical protein
MPYVTRDSFSDFNNHSLPPEETHNRELSRAPMPGRVAQQVWNTHAPLQAGHQGFGFNDLLSSRAASPIALDSDAAFRLVNMFVVGLCAANFMVLCLTRR